MAYGRLDVFFPDGNFRSFPLVNPTESVGRSPGNTIKLDAETISRYHFSIINQRDGVTLADLDSQNGTYVDGVKIPDGENVPLRGGEEITLGELRIIYHTMDEMPTQPMSALEDTTEIIQRDDAPFYLSIQPPPIAIPPGSHASAELTIMNTSDERGYYIITVTGVPRSWVRLDRPRALLEPHESGQVVINVRPARQPDTAPGEYTISVSVREESSPEYMAQATTRVHILPYGGFGVALDADEIDAGQRFQLHLHNQGSADLPLVVSGSNRTDAVELEFLSGQEVTVGPGQRHLLQGYARPKQRQLFGEPQTYPFDIVVRSRQANQFVAVVGGHVTSNPMMPKWALWAGGGVALVLVALLGLLLVTLATPAPALNNFTVSSTQVARGAALEVNWTVENVRELELLADDTPIAQLTPGTGAYTLDTTFLSQNAVIELRGANGRRTADPLQQRVQVYEPMQRVVFNVMPPQLVQQVTQTLTIQWEIENATRVQVLGLENFAPSYDGATTYDASGSLDNITGVSAGNLTIELFAEDALGNVFNDSVVLESIPAQCTPNIDPVPLRDGPDARYQQISTIQTTPSITVIGQDETGEWLAVALEGGLVGWGDGNQFTCANTFDPSRLRVITDVPPLPATPTVTVPPSPTIIPTVTPTSPPPTPRPPVTPGGVVIPPDEQQSQRTAPTPTAAG
jgi:hypothetical protein